MNNTNKIKISSNRNFGFVFFVFFLIVSFWPLIKGGELRIWTLIISVIFLLLGSINSQILTPLNKIWFKFGIFLGNFISPIVMGIVFFFSSYTNRFYYETYGKKLIRIEERQ